MNWNEIKHSTERRQSICTLHTLLDFVFLFYFRILISQLNVERFEFEVKSTDKRVRTLKILAHVYSIVEVIIVIIVVIVVVVVMGAKYFLNDVVLMMDMGFAFSR